MKKTVYCACVGCSPDFGIAGHFIDGVVDVHRVLDHRAVLKHLDLLGHAGDGEVVTVAVKLDTAGQVRMESLLERATDEGYTERENSQRRQPKD